MQIKCPSCCEQVEQHRPPSRGDANAGDAWVCMRCPVVVCVACYTQHNRAAHGALYGPKGQPTGGGKKNSKGKKR
jgi:hypothetical protein